MRLRPLLFLIVVTLELITIASLSGFEIPLTDDSSEISNYQKRNVLDPENYNSSQKFVEPNRALRIKSNSSYPYILKKNKEVKIGYGMDNHPVPFYNVRTNSKGLRDDEFKLEKPENQLRILFVGDSFTFGWGVNKSDRFTEIFERQADKDAEKDIEIINAGIPGIGMKNYYQFVEEKAPVYNPDIIVIVFQINDAVSLNRANLFYDKAVRKAEEDGDYTKEERIRIEMRLRRDFIYNSSKSLPVLLRDAEKVANSTKPGTELYFYSNRPLKKEHKNRIKKGINNLEASFISAPKEFAQEPEKFRLTDEDSHYNKKGHQLLGEKLIEKLGPKI